jgi:hypothetical protein
MQKKDNDKTGFENACKHFQIDLKMSDSMFSSGKAS